ncbi:MAG: glycine cleavage T C-terminal barrel domain-containing protein [Gemmatimonadota bacterium]
MSDDPLRARQAIAGASFATVGAIEVARHYGDAAVEYRAIREDAGIVRRDDRTQIRMWGRDPIKMLNGLVTNDLAQLSRERAVYSAMLTPKGRVVTDLLTFTRGEGDELELVIDIPLAALSVTSQHLKKYVPPLFARFEPLERRFGVLGVYGPRADQLVSSVFSHDASSEEDAVSRGVVEGFDVTAVGTRYVGGEVGYDLFGAPGALSEVWDGMLRGGAGAGARPVGFAAMESLRIEAGRPSYGAELSEEVLPGEAFEATHQMSRAVSFSKGCYTGQEVVIRIAHRGHVNRHVRGLLLADAPIPPSGTPLFRPDSEKEVGRITSPTQSPLMGRAIALGYLRREVSPGATVRVGSSDGAPAEVVDLPFSAP